ncbi:Calcium channel yvc1 [Umbelopsis nana]
MERHAEEANENSPLIRNSEDTLPKNEEISAAIQRLILLVTMRLPKFAIVERDGLEDAVVNESFAAIAKKACNIHQDSLIFIALKAMERFQIQAEGSPRWSQLLETRASICESLAHKFIRYYDKESSERFVAAIMQKHDLKFASDLSAIELAVNLHANQFLLEAKVQRVIHDVWNGVLLPHEGKDGRVVFKTNRAMARIKNGFFDPNKIHVPKYSNAIETIMTILFLVLYTIVINSGRTDSPSVLEWVLYTFVLAYVLDDIRDIYNTGMFHYYSFWACTNTLTHMVFIASFCLRVVALTKSGIERDYLNNTSIDVLSVVSILLWFRVLSVVCNTWRYFGSYTIIVQSMLSDSFMFFFLLIWVILGFFQAFVALRTEDTAQDNDFSEISALLLRGYLMSPDFDKAGLFHGMIGEPLFYAYIFLASVVLQSFLTSVFSDSFSRISDDAKAQYLAIHAYRVITAVDTRDSLPPPFNIVDLLVLRPPQLCLGRAAYKRFRYYALTIVFCVPLLIVTIHQKTVLSLDNARSDDSLSDDEGTMSEEQDFMTVEDEEVQDLKATVGEEDLQKIEKLAEKIVQKSQSDDTTPVSANEILHADIKVVVRMLDAIDRRLERLEATAPPPPPPAQ